MSVGPATGEARARNGLRGGLAGGPLRNAMSLIFGAKLKLAFNHLRDIRRHILVHVFAGVGTLAFLLIGGFFLFYFIFRFLQAPEQMPFGEPLMRRLIGMVFVAFFSMLTFSNLIIMLTTTYISREVEFLMALPIGHRRLFFSKLAESTLYSSWAFIILSMPFVVALGATSNPAADWTFYPAAAVIYIPFVVLPAALGAIVVLLVTAFVPAKKTFRLAVLLLVVGLGVAIWSARTVVGTGSLRGRESIARIMSYMSLGDLWWMPSTWLSRAINAALVTDWAEAGFWTAVMTSAALMALQICHWLAGPLYYRGYCNSRASASAGRMRQGGVFAFFDRLLRPQKSPVRALVVKDMTVFWRDPAQWGQLLVLFGLLLIYIANLGGAADLAGVTRALPLWKTLVSLFNIGATCFVLSILSTRFVYPMLSLEGKQQWVIGLAPLSRTALVWVKYSVAVATALGLTVPLILLSCYMLQADWFISVISVVTIITMTMGLNSLAVGLGALLPNFGEDNPSRIANGVGGTLNIILSLIYIVASIALEGPLMWYHLSGAGESETLPMLAGASLVAWVLLQYVTISLPLKVGLRHWRKLEF